MTKAKLIFGWVGIVLLGLINGILEDLLFINILVPYAPVSWDLTGNLFFTFTVPLAQLMALAITGTLAWFLCRLRELPRLITFWACWSVSRTTFLILFENPLADVAIYLLWIAFWCVLIGVSSRMLAKA